MAENQAEFSKHEQRFVIDLGVFFFVFFYCEVQTIFMEEYAACTDKHVVVKKCWRMD